MSAIARRLLDRLARYQDAFLDASCRLHNHVIAWLVFGQRPSPREPREPLEFPDLPLGADAWTVVLDLRRPDRPYVDPPNTWRQG